MGRGVLGPGTARRDGSHESKTWTGTMVKLIFGCGYLGQRIAQRWLEQAERPVVVTRSPDRARELARQGFEPHVADVTRPDTLAGLPAADTVLYAIGYDPAGGLSRDVISPPTDPAPSATG